MIPIKQKAVEQNVMITSPHSFEDTLDRLKQAIKAVDFLLIHEINTQKILANNGIKIAGLRQLLFFQPAYMQRLLTMNPEAILEVPLKLVVIESIDKPVVAYYRKPTELFAHYEGFLEFAEELENVVIDICYNIKNEMLQRSAL